MRTEKPRLYQIMKQKNEKSVSGSEMAGGKTDSEIHQAEHKAGSVGEGRRCCRAAVSTWFAPRFTVVSLRQLWATRLAAPLLLQTISVPQPDEVSLRWAAPYLQEWAFGVQFCMVLSLLCCEQRTPNSNKEFLQGESRRGAAEWCPEQTANPSVQHLNFR